MLRFLSKPYENILAEIWIWTTDDYWVIEENFNWTLVSKFPNCQVLDLHDYFDMRNFTPSMVCLGVKPVEGVSFTLLLEERAKQSPRALKSMIKSYSGYVPSIENLGIMRDIEYLVVLSQTIFDEKDERNPCKNYPHDEFQSYGDCDFDFVRDKVRNLTDIIPFWASTSRTLEDVEKLRY